MVPSTSRYAGGGDAPALRPATPAEAPAVADVLWLARTEAFPAVRHLEPPGHGSETGDDSESGGRGELAQLYLRSAWTGRGLGGQLVELARRSCPAGLDLWVFQSNPAAISFYERNAFVRGRTTDGDNEEGEPDLQMSWRPDSPAAQRAPSDGREQSG